MADRLQDHALVARIRHVHAVCNVVLAAVDSCSGYARQSTTSTRFISSGMITSVIRNANVSVSVALSVDSPDSSILAISLWFGHNGARPAPHSHRFTGFFLPFLENRTPHGWFQPSTARPMMAGGQVFLVLTAACQFGHGVGGFMSNCIHWHGVRGFVFNSPQPSSSLCFCSAGRSAGFDDHGENGLVAFGLMETATSPIARDTCAARNSEWVWRVGCG